MTHHYHTHPFNGPLSGTTRVSQYQKGETTSLSMDHKLDHPYNTENVNSVLFLGGWMKNSTVALFDSC